MSAGPTVLAGARVVTPDGVLDDGWVRIADGVLTEVGRGEIGRGEVSRGGIGRGDAPGSALDLGGGWLVPGFVDLHCHGGGGASYSSADPEQLRRSLATHREHGTTTSLASLVSAPVAELEEQIAALAELVDEGALAGIHLEGPFLSSARCGAHDTSVLRSPDSATVERLLSAGRGAVSMVTLAPELANSLDAIRQLDERGVIAAVGHTDGTWEQARAAIDAGATVATHLFNGMRPLHHREPGAVAALLEDERVAVELICDLVHLHPAVAALAAQRAGPDRTVLVTDAISATAAADGEYRLGDLAVTVREGVPRLADGSLAGSTLTMDDAFRNLVRGCGLDVERAVAATSTEPARLLGLADRVGAVREGLAADLVVLDEQLRLRGVLKHGQWVQHA